MDWDTIIVGGGISGCSCFRSLSRIKDHRVLLLEARDRLGGRSCTEYVNGHSVDTGGQWLGACHSKMLSYCREFGIEVEEQSFPAASDQASSDQASSAQLIELAYYKLKPLVPEAALQVAAFQRKLLEDYRRVSACGTVGMEEMCQWDSSSMLDVIKGECTDDTAVEELCFFVQTVLACEPLFCSYLFFLHYVFVWGGQERGMELLGDGPEGLQALKVKGGMQQISERLVYDAEKRPNLDDGDADGRVCGSIVSHVLGCAVESIEYVVENDNDDEASDAHQLCMRVKCTVGGNAQVFSCKRVVLALSPTLVHRGEGEREGEREGEGEGREGIAFSPASIVSEERRMLWDAMRMGNAVKVICVFRSSFWREQEQEQETQKIRTETETETETEAGADQGGIQRRESMSISQVGIVSNIFESVVGGGGGGGGGGDGGGGNEEEEVAGDNHHHHLPALICLITGHKATLFTSLSAKERQRAVLDQLKAMYPLNWAEPIHYVERDWMNQEHSGGAFAAIVRPTQGAIFARHEELLRIPLVEKRIWLAGTEASTRFYGYLEGAALRGEQVAEEIQAAIIAI